MVCDITYLITLNSLTLLREHFESRKKCKKHYGVNFNIYYRDQEEYCNILFRCQYFARDTKNQKLKNIFEQDNISFPKSLPNSNTSVI